MKLVLPVGVRDRLEVYQDTQSQWRWRLRAANGRTIADSAEGYTRRWSALRAGLRAFRGNTTA